MSGNKAESSATEHMDWTRVSEAEIELREEDLLKVSLTKMDEKTHQAKVGLTEKVKQREAEQRERERLAAEAEARRLAEEERVAEERCQEEEDRRHAEEVARKAAEGSKGKGKAKPRPCLVSKAVSTFILGCSDCSDFIGFSRWTMILSFVVRALTATKGRSRIVSLLPWVGGRHVSAART